MITMARPKTYHIILTDDELKQLKSVIRKKETSRTVRCRCQIIIDLDEAHSDESKIQWHFQTGDAREKLISLYPAYVASD